MSLELARRIFMKKSPQAQLQDLTHLARRVCSPDDKQCIKEWIRRKGVGIDILGIDTPPTNKSIKEELLEELVHAPISFMPEDLAAKVRKVLEERSPASLIADMSRFSRKVCSPLDRKCVEEWIRRRGIGIDIYDVDTPPTEPLNVDKYASTIEGLRNIAILVVENTPEIMSKAEKIKHELASIADKVAKREPDAVKKALKLLKEAEKLAAEISRLLSLTFLLKHKAMWEPRVTVTVDKRRYTLDYVANAYDAKLHAAQLAIRLGLRDYIETIMESLGEKPRSRDLDKDVRSLILMARDYTRKIVKGK